MEKFETHRERYDARIQRFFGYLTEINPDWISKRSWFEDLNKFELGDSFYYNVVFAVASDPAHKNDFYFGVLLYASINFAAKFGKKREEIESGFAIELETDELEYDKNEHEMLLGWLWWNAIFQKADNAGQFSPEQKEQLKRKQRQMSKPINAMD